jgi:LacI family transcriptional regulator
MALPSEEDWRAEIPQRIISEVKPRGVIAMYSERFASMLPKDMPIVWIDCPVASVRTGAHVRHDNASFGEMAAKTLLKGDGRMAVFGVDGNIWSMERERAFVRTVRACGRDCRCCSFNVSKVNPYVALEPIRIALQNLPRPLQVFAVTDWLADVVLMAAEQLGWKCPRDIRIVGVDNNELICMRSAIAISSVMPDWSLGGKLAAEALDALMHGEKTARTRVYGALGVMRRASTMLPFKKRVDDRVESGLAFIHSEFTTPIDVGDVVRAMGCSRRLAEIRFREATGKSIGETIADARYAHVCMLLSRRGTDISRLPDMCGFKTAAALRRFFRQRAGKSLGAYLAEKS